MKNAITTLRIQNFKSIKDVEIKPRRVNLILGEPNVGKSNVLEAISLLGGMVYDKNGEKFMNGQVRYQNMSQLYYDNLRSNVIKISSNKAYCIIQDDDFAARNAVLYLPTDSFERLREIKANLNLNFAEKEIWESIFDEVNRNGRIDASAIGRDLDFGYYKISLEGNKSEKWTNFDKMSRGLEKNIYVRLYNFNKQATVGAEMKARFLYPPDGTNLKNIIQQYSKLRQEVANMFRYYGLKLSLRMVSNEMEIIKEVNDLIYSYPYSSTADTLQRLIFYLAAIESNDDAVLLFEEPEAHSFPTYVAQLGQRIVESENNQFFIVTHSPYLVTEIFEEMVPKDELLPQLAVFVAYYEDYQTKIRQLTDEEVIQARADGLEMFYNLNRFIPERE